MPDSCRSWAMQAAIRSNVVLATPWIPPRSLRCAAKNEMLTINPLPWFIISGTARALET